MAGFSRRRWVLLCALALCLAILLELFFSWGVPNFEEKKASTKPSSIGNMYTPYDLFWTDGIRGGHYILHDRPFISHISFQRILFVGDAKDQPYYMKNPPPSWAATISVDMHEGFEQVDTVAVGWPWRCFRAEHWIAWTPRQTSSQPAGNLLGMPQLPPPLQEEFRGGLKHTFASGESVFFAHQPMWPGMMGNVLCFGTAWLLVFLGISEARRMWRRRRSLCPECAYNVHGLQSERCPECATLLQKKPRPAG